MKKKMALEVAGEVFGDGFEFSEVNLRSEKKGEYSVIVPTEGNGLFTLDNMKLFAKICEKRRLYYWITSRGVEIDFTKDE